MDIAVLEKENQLLRRAVEEISFLNELSHAIGSLFNSEEIMQTIIRKSIRAIHAEQGAIILIAEDDNQEMKTLVRSMTSYGNQKPFSLNQNLLGWMHINKKPLSITDPKKDERFSGIEWDKSVRSIACAPMIVKSNLTGILSVYNKKREENFTNDDLRLLSIIASQSAQIVENARLYEEEQALLKLREEARLAREIQITLLPKSDPAVPGYDIAGKSIPAMSVGGDYYDFIEMDNGRIAVCLGDISGKGMPAALLMSNLQATVRSQTLVEDSPRECIRRSNSLLFRSTDDNKYATFFYGILNPAIGEFCYTNAGHNPPLFITGGGNPVLLKSGGPVLGFLDNLTYNEETITLSSDDIIVIYSDGVTEAMDTAENEFGEERLEALVQEFRHLSSREVINTILEAVSSYSRSIDQSDDITVVVIKKT